MESQLPYTPPPPHQRGIRPFGAVEWLIARRYLGAQRRAGFVSLIGTISFLGIMLGVATLIIVMAVMNGFRSELLDRILGMNGHGVVYLRPLADGGAPDVTGIAGELAALPQVRWASPFLEGTALASSAAHAQGVLVRGLPPKALAELPAFASGLVAGSLGALQNKDGVLIGTRLAFATERPLNSGLTLITPRGAATPFGRMPNRSRFPVVGIFETGYSEYDGNLVVMSLASAQALLAEGPSHQIELFFASPDEALRARADIEAVVRERGQFVDWQQRHGALASALKVERNVMFLILTLILLVAALNIVSGMVMMVQDKAREIAVLRGLGISRQSILRIFILDGAAIGITGTLLGVALGLLFCAYIEPIRQFLNWASGADLFPAEVYFLQELPAEPNSTETLAVVGMALALSLLSTLYPAWRAASLDPVEALRYE